MSSSIFMLYWAVGLLLLIVSMRSDKFMREWASEIPVELDATMPRDVLVVVLTVLLMAAMLLWPFIVLRRREK